MSEAAGNEGGAESTGHQPAVELAQTFPAEVEAAAEIPLRVRASCPEGCDLQGGVVNIENAEAIVLTSVLGASEGAEAAETPEIVLKAPAELGEASWSVVFPRQEIGGAVHEECALHATSTVLPHTTSVAVWGVPSPFRGSRFSVKVGIKCSAECRLSGQRVEVRDEAGAKVGEGTLGDDPRPGTSALYEAEVSLVAPDEAGIVTCSADFAPQELDLPHRAASGHFTFRSLEPPEHTVTVRVVPKGLEASLANIDVRLGPYRTETDEQGVAKVGVPKGTYELSAFRTDIEPASTELEVRGDATVEVEAKPRQEVDEDAERMWM